MYKGLPFALVQGPMSRFGDTAANALVTPLTLNPIYIPSLSALAYITVSFVVFNAPVRPYLISHHI